MKILFAYTGYVGPRATSSVPADLSKFPTTHMSEVNYLLICHWLKELGHEITIAVKTHQEPVSYFPPLNGTVDQTVADRFDALFIFKIHGLMTVKELNLLRFKWKRVLLWSDAQAPEGIVGAEAAQKITHFAWGTFEIYNVEHRKFPNARHVVCEHACVFVDRPQLSNTRRFFGLYLGRLPSAYFNELKLAAQFAKVDAFALWLEAEGRKILLRPGQFEESDLAAARMFYPDLYAGINVIHEATALSEYAFGLCPATQTTPQLLSASKFYDYLALGLPVVIASNVPEATYIWSKDILGVCYRQGDPASLKHAIDVVLNCYWPRHQIQNWVFSRATYQHRAKVLHDFVTG